VLLFGVSAALAASAAVAQSPEWQKVLAAAKKEGQVVLYTAQVVPVVERIAGGFRKAYPDIKLEFTRGPSGPLLSKIEQERGGNLDGADLFISTEVSWFDERAKEGKLLKPTGPAAATWPSQYVQNGSVLILALEPLTILYNKNLVSVPPKSYQDLLKPEYKGRIGTSDLAATTLIAWYDWIEKTQGSDYLLKLKALEPKLYVGASPISQAIASGEIAVSAFGNATVVTPLKEKGAPIEMVIPNPSLGIQYAGGAFGWSKRPNAAMVLLDYMMSVEGQTLWHSTGESASPRTGIKGSLVAASITPWDPSKYPPEVVKAYRDRWNKIFK
jgi:iron(III) transport system substrate-binding protein